MLTRFHPDKAYPANRCSKVAGLPIEEDSRAAEGLTITGPLGLFYDLLWEQKVMNNFHVVSAALFPRRDNNAMKSYEGTSACGGYDVFAYSHVINICRCFFERYR